MNKNGSKTVRSRGNHFTAWPWRDGRNRNRKEQQRPRSRKETAQRVAVAWHSARRDARSCACRCMHARQQAGTMGASSTRQGTGGLGAAQDRSREGQRPAAWAHRGKKGRGLGPAAAWLAARKKKQQGRCLYRRWRVLDLRAKGRIRIGPAWIGLRRKEKKEKRAGLLIWVKKVFPIFLFAKRFKQIRFEFKLHEFEFKSNHKQ